MLLNTNQPTNFLPPFIVNIFRTSNIITACGCISFILSVLDVYYVQQRIGIKILRFDRLWANLKVY